MNWKVAAYDGTARYDARIGVLGLYLMFALFSPSWVRATEVPLVKAGGVFEVPVRVNGVITLNFIVDSGASTVQIPADVALTLLRTGTIAPSDFLPGAAYTLADGTTVNSPRVTLRDLEINGRTIRNVEASVGSPQGSLLLGQSFLARFSTWSLDNQHHVLILGDSDGSKSRVDKDETDATRARATGVQTQVMDGSPAEPPSATSSQTTTWRSDWGNDIRAIAKTTTCSVAEFSGQGYQYDLSVHIPRSRLRNSAEAWSVFSDRAETVKGCWVWKEDGLAHVKMKRKKDNKVSEQDLNFKDGSWTKDAVSTQGSAVESTNTNSQRYVYFAASTAPTGRDVPLEAPLCYRFGVAHLEEQLAKLTGKYGESLYGVQIAGDTGARTLTAERKGEQGETIAYRYYEDPRACMDYQQTLLREGGDQEPSH